MQAIIDFFEYTLDGGAYLIYVLLMFIFSFACLGVVGEKVSKRKHAEMLAKREELARKESEKARELVKKQADSYSINNVLDPTANENAGKVVVQNNNTALIDRSSSMVDKNVISADGQADSVIPEVIELDKQSQIVDGVVVDDVTPVVDNASDGIVKKEEVVPTMLVVNSEGTTKASN